MSDIPILWYSHFVDLGCLCLVLGCGLWGPCKAKGRRLTGFPHMHTTRLHNWQQACTQQAARTQQDCTAYTKYFKRTFNSHTIAQRAAHTTFGEGTHMHTSQTVENIWMQPSTQLRRVFSANKHKHKLGIILSTQWLWCEMKQRCKNKYS